MKTLNALILLVFWSCIFQSCNKSEEEPKPQIVGLWQVDNLEFDILIENQSFSEFLGEEGRLIEALITAELDKQLENLTFEFKSDNSFEISLPGQDSEVGTWSVNSEQTELTIDSDIANAGVYKIKSISNTSLILNAVETDNSQDFNDDGVPEEVKIEFDFYLIK